MSKRQITIKPACMRELLNFPSDRTSSLWEKIGYLVNDPFPDGKVKKKLRDSDGIYRLRVGNHRVFYRFGDDWVSLLGIRRRREDTYRGVPRSEDNPSLPPEFDDDLDALFEQPEIPTFSFSSAASQESPLPHEISTEWLEALHVPRSSFPELLRCSSEEELLDAPVDPAVLARVIDAMFPPPLREVVQQPDLVVPSAEDLVRYKEGDLLGFLLRLDDEQARFASWALKGPTMVRGGAGTGKSTVALYRVKEVLEREGATGQETLLFTTYTRALLTVTRQLLEQLLSPDQLKRVRVATVDQIAREVVASTRRFEKFESGTDALRRLRALRESFVPSAPSAFDARLRARALARQSDRYIIEEFDWIIDGRGLSSVEDYKNASRPGRGIPFPEKLRETVWQLHEAFVANTSDERFPALRNEAREVIRRGEWDGHWDYVFVDEAQDLSPAALALMAEVAKAKEGLFFAADSKQSLYSRNYSWSSVHPRLQFRGRTAVLRQNYRSTREIDRAAFSILHPEAGETLEPSSSVHQGPMPVLVRDADEQQEAEWIARFIQQMARHLHLRPSAAAVLVPNSSVGKELAEWISDAGVPAEFFAGREIDLTSNVVKVITLYSAKGLEFPMVVSAGHWEGTYPEPDDFEEPALFEERMRHERRLLYVGLTRAMRGLMLVVPKRCRHHALLEIDEENWHVEDIR